MTLTFNHNHSVRNEFLGSKFCRKVLSHMTFDKILQALLGMNDLSVAGRII